MNNSIRAHLALLATNIIYGANFSIAKTVMPEHILPAGFILLRIGGALVLYWLVSSFIINEKVERKDLAAFAMLGFFGVSVNQLLFFKGLNLTSPINASIMMVSNPILVLLAATIILKERITLTRITGVVLGFAGATALLLTGTHKTGTAHWSGDLMILLNSASWGVYLVLVKPYMKKYHTLTVVKWCFLFGFLYVLPFGWGELNSVEWSGLDNLDWISLVFVVFATTFIAYLLNTYALRALSPPVVSAYIYLQPFVATSIALFFGKDMLTFQKLTAAALIFFGVYLVSRPTASNK